MTNIIIRQSKFMLFTKVIKLIKCTNKKGKFVTNEK